MTNNSIQFYSFDEAVELARKEPQTELVGVCFPAPFDRLDVYIINVDADEPNHVNVFHEGGLLFRSSGEEDCFDLEDVPADAKSLFYARKVDLGNGDPVVMGMTSEFVLQEVVPSLSEDAKYRDHAHFMQAAGAAFQAFWRLR